MQEGPRPQKSVLCPNWQWPLRADAYTVGDENTPAESVRRTAEARASSTHAFAGWKAFLRHLREDHGVEPPSDDGEAWLAHEGLHPESGPP
jgi:hypothetical protein